MSVAAPHAMVRRPTAIARVHRVHAHDVLVHLTWRPFDPEPALDLNRRDLRSLMRRLLGHREQPAAEAQPNVTNVFQLPVPMGGWGASGLGSRHGAEGIRKYCRQQTVVAERGRLPRAIYWYPTTARKAKVMAKATPLLGTRDWRRRLGLGRSS